MPDLVPPLSARLEFAGIGLDVLHQNRFHMGGMEKEMHRLKVVRMNFAVGRCQLLDVFVAVDLAMVGV